MHVGNATRALGAPEEMLWLCTSASASAEKNCLLLKLHWPWHQVLFCLHCSVYKATDSSNCWFALSADQGKAWWWQIWPDKAVTVASPTTVLHISGQDRTVSIKHQWLKNILFSPLWWPAEQNVVIWKFLLTVIFFITVPLKQWTIWFEVFCNINATLGRISFHHFPADQACTHHRLPS